MLVSLVGLPGSGKTTVGRHLAKRLKWRFVDVDQLIEEQLGVSIRQFFEREGEDAFRDVEQAMVLQVLQSREASILSTGGGVVIREANRQQLRNSSTVVYLLSTPEELSRRLRHDTHRPLLQVGNPLAKLRELFAQRDPLYRETAHFVVETGRPSVSTLVNMVLMQLELAGLVDPSAVPSSVKSAEG